MRRVLVANRGEIAVRVIRACHEAGLEAVAVHSDADAGALHCRVADRSLRIGEPSPAASYLNAGAILGAAREAGADALHPGYGFLSENAGFAAAVEAAGLTWIGPPPEAIRLMGSKTRARRLAAEVGVPLIPGATGDDTELAHAARRLGYPVVVKAAAGGGGRGMRVVREGAGLAEALEAARREARGAFGDDEVYLERWVARPRHVEVQVLSDAHGGFLQLGERECSIQRRHQKVVEEAPSPALDPGLRARMGAAALAITRGCGYRGAGTVEFVLAPDGSFYFLEVNTRIQVEHAVTECVTGVDLVREQLRVAAGEPLGLGQGDLSPRGHALECRIYAEDPAAGFLPSGGLLAAWHSPSGPGVRVDAGYEAMDTVPLHYDALLAKLVVHAPDRPAALGRMAAALADFFIAGVRTNVEFLRSVVGHPAFAAGETDTGFLERHLDGWRGPGGEPPLEALAAAALACRARPAARTVADHSPWSDGGGWLP